MRDNISESELARRMGQTPQNLHNKYQRDAFKVAELERIADALDADLQIKFIDRNSKEPII